jgi:hypothetical protein
MRLGRQITKAQKSIANRRKWVRLQTTPSATKGFLIKNSLKSTESRKQHILPCPSPQIQKEKPNSTWNRTFGVGWIRKYAGFTKIRRHTSQDLAETSPSECCPILYSNNISTPSTATVGRLSRTQSAVSVFLHLCVCVFVSLTSTRDAEILFVILVVQNHQ